MADTPNGAKQLTRTSIAFWNKIRQTDGLRHEVSALFMAVSINLGLDADELIETSVFPSGALESNCSKETVSDQNRKDSLWNSEY